MTDIQNERDNLTKRIDTIEEAYEFMLAYAAQGRQGDEEWGKGNNIRTFLERADAALEGLGADCAAIFEKHDVSSAGDHRKFLEVFNQDVHKAQAAIRLVLALPLISSQLIDNLNASIHLRTLLTDLFLIDETLKIKDRSLK